MRMKRGAKMAAYTIEEHPLSAPYALPEDAPNALGWPV